jgi:hypothetical protein
MRYDFFPNVFWMDFFFLQNTLIQEGKEMASLLYTYRSCVKALPQVSVS